MPKVKKGGLLPDPRSFEEKIKDHVLGVNTFIQLPHKVSKEEKYLPLGEAQSPAGFESSNCATHSAYHPLAHQMTFYYQNKLYREDNLKFLEDEGYLHDGKVRFSVVFGSIGNGTTKDGNWVHAVWDHARSSGLIPYKDLPFTGKTWQENHDPKLITQSMLERAKRFYSRFEIKYAWLPTDSQLGVNISENEAIEYYQQYGFLQIGTPIPAYHCTSQVEKKGDNLDILETYVPFYRKQKASKYPVNFYVFGYVIERPEVLEETPPLKRLLKIGMSGEDVRQLQANLRKLGYFTYPVNTAYFGWVTQLALKNFQRDYGIPQTGQYYTLSHAQVYKLLNK